MKVLVNGAASCATVPGLEKIQDQVELLFANSPQEFAEQVPEAEILMGWSFKSNDLKQNWPSAKNLKWVHCCSAGVDAVLFPELVSSDVVVTNSRGVFDHAMAEYVLGYMLSEVKRFKDSIAHQQNKTWGYQTTQTLSGQKVAIYGVGSIGQEIARVLSLMGMEVKGVGRSARYDDPVFGNVAGYESRMDIARQSDWVVAVLPQTDATIDYFNQDFFESMPPHARFINVGRGTAVDEQALMQALNTDRIAGAMLDVFKQEPLPVESDLWQVKNLTISGHMSGDYATFEEDLVKLFIQNLERYTQAQPLLNLIDKQSGFSAVRFS